EGDPYMRLRPMRAIAVVASAAATILILSATTASAAVPVTRVSTDPFTSDTAAQHRTEVEPDTFSFGGTTVSAFQTGRVFGGGSSDIGFVTLNSTGGLVASGFLPGITRQQGNGPYHQASDAA